MKILVVPRYYIERCLEKNVDWYIGKNIISIYSNDSFSPLYSINSQNILRLEFDDVAEPIEDCDKDLIYFNEQHANQIKVFVEKMNHRLPLFVHCDAGISRSGAVGFVLNEYFNKFLNNDENDYKLFCQNNPHILPNPLVKRLLTDCLFGKPDYSSIWS